ncbi:DUF134 domain-containing protein [Candidatus Woesearchaeota archaeon]|nr:DUF134 domain-containing protein [Candidatus Woesearchaeota archaeon]
MPRPRLLRRVRHVPDIVYFKPAGVRLAELDEVVLTFDELEAIRWCDLEQIDQVNAAKKMSISQSTLHRTLLSARKKLADAIVNGNAIRIEGGRYKMVAKKRRAGAGPGRGLRRGRGSGAGRGRMGGKAEGPGGACVCPKCGRRVAHQVGIPCYEKKCPVCNVRMARG